MLSKRRICKVLSLTTKTQIQPSLFSKLNRYSSVKVKFDHFALVLCEGILAKARTACRVRLSPARSNRRASGADVPFAQRIAHCAFTNVCVYGSLCYIYPSDLAR